MPNWILVDTDVLVDFLRGNENAATLVREFSARIVLSPIVIAELYAGVKGKTEMAVLEDFISLFRVAPLTAEIARRGGLYKRDFGKSHGVGLADSLLAATVEVENAELKTLNVKHYPMFTGLRQAYQK